MTRKDYTALTAQANETLPDNVTGLISPADVRNMVLDFLDTTRPTYCAIAIGTPGIPVPCTPTYNVFSWQSILEDPATDWTVSLASGNITREQGPATCRITFNIDVVAPNNIITSFALYRDGVLTPWAVSNTSTSGTDVQSFSLSALTFSSEVKPSYQIRVKTNANATITVSNAVFVCENVPVNTP